MQNYENDLWESSFGADSHERNGVLRVHVWPRGRWSHHRTLNPGSYRPIGHMTPAPQAHDVCGCRQSHNQSNMATTVSGCHRGPPGAFALMQIFIWVHTWLNLTRANRVLNGFGCKMVITPKPSRNNELVSMLSLLEFITSARHRTPDGAKTWSVYPVPHLSRHVGRETCTCVHTVNTHI